MQRAVGLFDVAEDTAGADRGELLIITDQPDTGTRPMANCTAASRVRVSAMPASSMISNVEGPTAAAQSVGGPCCRDQVSLASVLRPAQYRVRCRSPPSRAGPDPPPPDQRTHRRAVRPRLGDALDSAVVYELQITLPRGPARLLQRHAAGSRWLCPCCVGILGQPERRPV